VLLNDPAPAALAALDALAPGPALGVAVSGGGDSVALMRLAALWGARRGALVAVATVDHGLRAASAAEAASVVAQAASLGLEATALRWEGWDRRGNLQAQARAARYRLLADWARARGLGAVALGHTLDDQAETVLLRLMRGSGVDGLAAMAPAATRDGVRWLRPLLGLRRADLRGWLAAQGAGWIEDPSNDDARFQRVRARRAMDALGLDAAGLAQTAARMGRARAALEAQTAALWAQSARVGACGEVLLAREALRAAPPEIALRLLADALRAASGAALRPRLEALEALCAALASPGAMAGRTLHGCVVAARGDGATLAREPAAAARGALARGLCDGLCDGLWDGLWDGRWRVAAQAPGAIGALGEAGAAALRAAARAGTWAAPPGWRAAPRAARLTTPCLWRDGRLGCAPIAGYGAGLEAAWAAPLPAGLSPCAFG